MCKLSSPAFLALLTMSLPAHTLADEIHRLTVDLDGDKKPETIQISTAPTTEDWRKRFIVQIGKSDYSDSFFSVEGDLPDVRVVIIDRERSQRQLLIHSPEPGTCIYHVLAYSSETLIPLLRFDSGPNCQAPQPNGGGLTTVTWEGFWNRDESYRLSKDGVKLVAELRDSYGVGVAGAAGKALVLESADCASHEVAPNMFIRVKLFEVKKNRYFIESADGACGWIPASKVNTLNDMIKELPWAG